MSKPLDFGGGGITGSIDRLGRLIALNSYHPQHGYVTLTSADPFPEAARYDPAAVRAYRARLAQLNGFGLRFEKPIASQSATLIDYAIPHVELAFEGGGHAQVTTFASGGGARQIWRLEHVACAWSGHFSLMRCTYTELTEGNPLPPIPVEMNLHFEDGTLTIENPRLGWAVAIVGLAARGQWDEHTDGSADIDIPLDDSGHISRYRITLTYGFGTTAPIAIENARRISLHDPDSSLRDEQSAWRARWGETIPPDKVLRRGLAYSLTLAIPVDEGMCLLTDHMLLPLSWNRDAYYAARALLSWRSARSEMAEVVRRHLIWMFELAERVNYFWGRCYLANGKIKDRAFQLDQQLFPLLELAEYVLETGDHSLLDRLQSHVQPLLASLMQRKVPDALLFPTDETPADDPIPQPYHLSSHVLLWRVLTLLEKLGIPGLPMTATALRSEIDRWFISRLNGRELYAYATDGQGDYHFYHDANDFPVALMPNWGMVTVDDMVWRATADFAFSPQNPGYFNGHLGSLHTPAPWALGDLQELIIAHAEGNAIQEIRLSEWLSGIAQPDGALPEAYASPAGDVVSRHWFAWPNAAFACYKLEAFTL